MLRYFTFLVFLLSVVFIQNATAQRALAFDQYRWGRVKTHKFLAGDDLKVKLFSGEKIDGKITMLADSAVGIDDVIVRLKDVKKIYRERTKSQVISYTANKVFYLIAVIPIANGIIEGDNLADERILIPAASAAGVALFFEVISNTKRGFKVKDKHRLRIMFWG
ncbi:MAG: hypothetical protein CL843_03145 [Crocinitomicaceae bacterium]|nr:hypothetical protein [Crocinitomicaceae bacterium]|tara:strand:- start:10870 stop:11361 length:492 start_codon:yes stop_codon:yes gene_type:complete